MKKLFIYISALSLIIFTGGCKKQLDLLPTDSIDITKAYKSVSDLEQGLLGVYSANNQMQKEYIGTILADEAKLSDENRGQGQFEFKWQYSSGSGGVTTAYRQYYSMIDRIHRVQAGLLTVTPAKPDPSFESVTLPVIVLWAVIVKARRRKITTTENRRMIFFKSILISKALSFI